MTIEEMNSLSAEIPSHLANNTNISSSPSDSISLKPDPKSSESHSEPPSTWGKIYAIVTYTPKRCRYDPANPPGFSMSLNLLFGFAATFTVANLYYNHPILNKLAESFEISNEKVSTVPTLMQAGYAAGLLFLCPLGDIFRRRAFVLMLVWFTATVWYDIQERAVASGAGSEYVAALRGEPLDHSITERDMQKP